MQDHKKGEAEAARRGDRPKDPSVSFCTPRMQISVGMKILRVLVSERYQSMDEFNQTAIASSRAPASDGRTIWIGTHLTHLNYIINKQTFLTLTKFCWRKKVKLTQLRVGIYGH